MKHLALLLTTCFLLSSSTALAATNGGGIIGKAYFIKPTLNGPDIVIGPLTNRSFNIRDSRGQLIAQFGTDRHGRFRVPLRPGKYRVSIRPELTPSLIATECTWPGRIVNVSATRFSSFR